MTVLAAPRHWHDLARQQGGVVSRAQVLEGGGSRHSWEHLIASASTQLLLPGVVLLGSAPPDERQRAWAAVLYGGGGAALGGLSALRAQGVRLDEDAVHLAVPAGRRVVAQPSPASVGARYAARRRAAAAPPDSDRRAYEVRLRVVPHQVADLVEQLAPGASPPHVAAVHAALQSAAWARSDAEAETVLAVAVQRRLVTPGQLRIALLSLPKLRRRALLRELFDELESGATARSELLFLRLLQVLGLPRPDVLQRAVRVGSGKRYLDAWWERRRVAVEVDGAHHLLVVTWEADLLRNNAVALAHDRDRALLLRCTTGQLRRRDPDLVAQLRAALL